MVSYKNHLMYTR